MSNEKIFPANIYNVWSFADLLHSSLALPDDVLFALSNVISVCSPYIINGFKFEFGTDE